MDSFTDRSQFRIGDLLVKPDRFIAMHARQTIPPQRRIMTVPILLAGRPGMAISPATITDHYLEDCRL